MPPARRGSGKAKKGEEEGEEAKFHTFEVWPGDEAIQSTEYFNPAEAKAHKDAKSAQWPYEDDTGKLLPTEFGKPVRWIRITELAQELATKKAAEAAAASTLAGPAAENGSVTDGGGAAPTASTEPADADCTEDGTPVIVMPGRQGLVDIERFVTPAEKRYAERSAKVYPVRKTEIHTNLVRHNAHLLGSELGRTLVQHLHELQRVDDDNDAHTTRVWERVWPQTKNPGQAPMPQYNESGKYLVKLFWLNAWRKVYVDDLLPMGENDEVLLPTGPSTTGGVEFWPALIAKAILKLVAPYMVGTVKHSQLKFGEAEIMQILTGWQAESIALSDNSRAKVLQRLLGNCPKLSPWLAVEPPSQNTPVEDDDEAPSGGTKGRSALGGRRSAAGSAKGARSVKDKAPRRKSAMKGRGDPDKDEDVTLTTRFSEDLVRRNYVLARVARSASGKLQSPYFQSEGQRQSVQVLECVYLPQALHGRDPDYEDSSNWILRCQSPLAQFKDGKLAYSNAKAWTPTLLLGTEVSRENELARQDLVGEDWSAWDGARAHRWHMTLAEFEGAFSSITIHHKVDAMDVATVELSGLGPQDPITWRSGLTAREEREEKALEGKGPHFTSANQGQPIYFCFDSLEPASAVVTLAVVPTPIQPTSSGGNDVPSTADSTASTPAVPSESPQERVSEPTDGAEGSTEDAPQFDTAPQGLLLARYNWKSTTAMTVGCQILTANTRSVSWELKAGRQVYKLVPTARGTHSLSIAFDRKANVETSLREEREALEFLGEDSLRQRNYALRISKLVGFMVKEHASWDQTIKLMSLMSQLPETWECHNSDGAETRRHEQLGVFWEALQSTLRLTFNEDPMRWLGDTGDPTPLAIAWIRLIKTVRETTEGYGKEDESKPTMFSFKKTSVIHKVGSKLDAEALALASSEPPASAPPSREGKSISGRDDPIAVEIKAPSKQQKKGKVKLPPQDVTIETLSKKHGVSLEEMERAVKPLQRGLRKHLARKKMKKMRKRALTVDEHILRESWDKIQPNLPAFSSLLFRRMLEVDVDLKWKFDFEDDIAQMGTVVDIPSATSDLKDPLYVAPYEAREPFDWCFLAKTVVRVKQPTLALVLKRLCQNVAAENRSGALLDTFVRLHIVDNDTLTQVPTTFNDVIPHEFVPNTSGYTIIAVANAPVPLPDFRLAIRVMSSPEWPLPQSYVAEFDPHVETGEVRPMNTPGSGYLVTHEDGSTSVRYDVLFRFQIQFPSDQLAALQFGLNPTQVPGAVLKLDLFREKDDGEVVASVTSKHCAFLPFVKVEGNDEAAAASNSGAEEKSSAKGGKGGRGSHTKSAKSSKGSVNVDRPPSTADSAASEHREPKIAKYVIRGRLLDGDVQGPPDKAEAKNHKGKHNKFVAPTWKLQIFTEGKALVSQSRARAEEIESEQIGWEAVEEGRSTKSADVRNQFLSEHPNGAESIGVEKPTAEDTTSMARVYDENLKAERENQRTQTVRAYEARCAQLTELAQQRVSARREGKSSHVAKFDELAELRAAKLGAAQLKREEYRQRVLEEATARQKVDAAREAALAAELQIRELLDPALAAGGGKKKKK